MEIASAIFAGLALGFSVYTLWRQEWHRGKLIMTQPTMICFVPKNGNDTPKVWVKTLLVSSAMRGHIVENIFVKLIRDKSVFVFEDWIHDVDNYKQHEKGSGLFVSKNGSLMQHNLLILDPLQNYTFQEGNYELQVHIKFYGEKKHNIFYTTSLEVSKEEAKQITSGKSYLEYNWSSTSEKYYPNLVPEPEKPNA